STWPVARARTVRPIPDCARVSRSQARAARRGSPASATWPRSRSIPTCACSRPSTSRACRALDVDSVRGPLEHDLDLALGRDAAVAHVRLPVRRGAHTLEDELHELRLELRLPLPPPVFVVVLVVFL